MQPLAPVTLVGRHVRLEPLSSAHLPGLLAAAAEDRETYRLTWVPPDKLAMAAYIESAIADTGRGKAVAFATVSAEDGRVVGSTRFGNCEHWDWPAGSVHQRPAGCVDAVEIGWTWLAASAQRTGINTEAKRLMLGHAFEVWDVHRVTLKTDARNSRSRAAIERLGAKLDGLLRAHMPAYDDQVRTSAVYTILRDEWPAVRERLDGLTRR